MSRIRALFLCLIFMIGCLKLVPYFLSTEIQHEYPRGDRLRLVKAKGNVSTVYVVENGFKHKVPDEKTLFYLEKDVGFAQETTNDELMMIPTGNEFLSWKPNQRMIKKHDSKFIIESKRVSSAMINPALVKWQGKYIACFKVFVPHPEKSSAFNYIKDRIACQWLTNSFDLQGESVVVRTSDSTSSSSSYLVGEDPRLFVTPSGSLAIYYSRVVNVTNFQYHRIFFCELHQYLHLAPSTRVRTRSDQSRAPVLFASPVRALYYPDVKGAKHQKNWTPFKYKNESLFVYSVIPFHRVIALESADKQEQWESMEATIDTNFTKSVTLTRVLNASVWDFGDIQGGSPPILTPLGYLSFFHSSSRGHSSRWWAMSHFMGAYLFSQEPPFAVLQMTREPIAAKPFYTGEWTSSASHTDGVVFPTSAFLAGDEVVVACGLHGREAWVLRMSWAGLVSSMAPVHSDVIFNSLASA